MNTDIIESIDKTISFLKELIDQLNNFNSISESNIKLLCFIVYKQSTITKNKEIEHLLLTALSYINKDTKVYSNNNLKIENYNKIFEYYINTQMKMILED